MSLLQAPVQTVAAIGRRVERRRRRRGGLALPVGLGLLLTILVLLPIVLMFLGAVRTGTFVDPRAQFSLRSLQAVYTTLPFLKTLAVTVGASLLVSLIACIFGIALAWLLARTDIRARGFMEQCVIAPLYLSPFVGALAWLILASPNAGLLNVMARNLFGIEGTILNVVSATGVVLIMALYNVPYAYMTVSSALKGMDPSMEEASYLNGAGTFMEPGLDLIQTLPPYIYLLPAIALLGYGPATALIATIIVAMPPVIRLTSLGIRMTPNAFIELGEASGITPVQMFFKIRLPFALPSIMAGVNQSLMMAFGMVVIAGIVGSGGLGETIYGAIRTLDIATSINGAIAIVVLTMVLDRITQSAARFGAGRQS